MAVRKVFSCDWCGVDSPSPGFIGDRWVTFTEPLAQQQQQAITLCFECAEAARAALRSARHQRAQTKK